MDCISVSTLDSDSPIDVSAVQSLFFCIFPDFGDLPWLLPLALGLAAVAADAFLYRYLKGYVVR